MSENLKEIIHYICYYFPRDVNRTVLVKLVYLTDVEFFRRYYRKFTEVEYEYDNYGAFSWEIVDTAYTLVEEGKLKMTREKSFYGDEAYKYSSLIEPDSSELNEHIKEVIRYIIDKFSSYTFDGLLRYVYSNPPLTLFKRGDVIDFNMMKDTNQLSNREKEIARIGWEEVYQRAVKRINKSTEHFDSDFDEQHLAEMDENTQIQMKMLSQNLEESEY